MMSETKILYATLLFVVALISLLVAAIVWRRRSAPGGRALVAFMLAMAWWSATYALYWADVYPFGLFWLDATYIGVTAAAPAFFIFTLRFTHRESWVNLPLLAVLIFQPVLTNVLLWTDPWHGLFFAGQRSAGDSTIFSGGPWFWENLIYSYCLNLLTVMLLIKSLISARALFRRQIGLVLSAAFIPWAANIITLIGFNPLPDLDLTPIAFTLTGGIMAFTLFQYRFLEVVPIARDKLIENMKDGILVADRQNRVVDANPALTELLGVRISSFIGRKVETALPEWLQDQLDLEGPDNAGQEIRMPGNPPGYLDVRLIRLRDRHRHEQGKLMILQDISFRKKLESDREGLIATLRNALGQVKTLKGLLPICANCKKIRDDQGNWQDISVYIHRHSEAEFSHGICPECMERLYPEYSGDTGE
ncbi:MAG: histidine kinase N-terminal 7TM domain-containing protein [Desulfosalsimonadaceae bacterium]|nr:histidine kinase N-terminal 7TM domain-containing protein [Desulfosalsimonadaceae bacterium]